MQRDSQKIDIRPFLALLVLLVVGLILWRFSSVACAVVFFQLPYLAGIFLTIFAIGFIILRALGLDIYFSPAESAVISIATGCGVLAQIIHITGLLGLASSFIWFWRAFVCVFSLIGLGALLYIHQFGYEGKIAVRMFPSEDRFWTILLLLLFPYIVLSLAAATLPAGILWAAEGNGYDILEYHLQVPKEWFQAERIIHLPHNVYANFPLNMEMLYLLGMYLKADPISSVYIAQMIHLTFAVFAAWAVWLFTRPLGIRAAVFASLSFATCGWIVYLAVLAYNEMGIIFTGVVSLGIILRLWIWGKEYDAEDKEILKEGFGPIAVIMGIILGNCSGFKYTAFPMVVVPLLILFVFVLFVYLKRAFLPLKLFGLTFLVSIVLISPYLVRNMLWTGNPIFPLAYSIFGGKDFTTELANRWQRGHSSKLLCDKGAYEGIKDIKKVPGNADKGIERDPYRGSEGKTGIARKSAGPAADGNAGRYAGRDARKVIAERDEDRKSSYGDAEREVAEKRAGKDSVHIGFREALLCRLSRLYECLLRNVLVDGFLAEYYRSRGDISRAEEILDPPGIKDLPKFGLAILLLPYLIFLTRRQNIFDWTLLFGIVWVVFIWLFLTHLQARFLVPIIVFAPYLIARSSVGFPRLFSSGGLFILAVLLAAVFLNFADANRRYQRHVYFGGKRITLEGAEIAFVEGYIGGYEYLEYVNKHPEKRVLLVGEARPFYIKTPHVIYNTVFNRNLLAESLSISYKEAISYIERVRPDFIYVNWEEVKRLRRTYGFDDSIRPGMFYYLSRTSRYSLKKIGSWGRLIELDARKVPARELYEVIYKRVDKIGRTR